MLFISLTIANIKMIVRNRQALFWALAFPLAFVFFFSLIGSFSDSTVTIGVVDNAGDTLSRQLIDDLEAVDGFELERFSDEAMARELVREGDLAHLLIVPELFYQRAQTDPPAAVTLIYSDGQFGDFVSVAVDRFLNGMNLDLADADARVTLSTERALSDGFDFMEFVVPGIALWGIMSSSIIGMAVTLANYREKKILRRIRVSPMRAHTFFAAQIAAYLILALVQAGMVLGVGGMVMGINILGSNLLAIGLLILLSGIVFLNLGFIVGAFSKTGAAASGLGNLIVLPMIMLSGIFFPTDLLPDALASAMQFLPLFPMVEILRGITLGTESLFDFPLEISVILAWIALTSGAAIRLFEFE